MVGTLLSYWGGLFSGAMLVSGRVCFFGDFVPLDIQTPPEKVFGPQKHAKNTFSWQSNGTPPMPPPPRNKALLGDY